MKDSNIQLLWRVPSWQWVVLVAALALIMGLSWEGLVEMERRWRTNEEYGYGYLIPVISLFLIWQRWDQLRRTPFEGSWGGVALLLGGVLVTLVGNLSSIYAVIQYGFVIALMGLVLAVTGWQVFRRYFLVPLALLFFMIPLPTFLYRGLSNTLQLLSSEVGVAVIRAFGISVYLEGNVIDLGAYKLQVVEACSGLRYLFPLTSLAFISAYFYKEAFWKRAVVFFSSMPITVLMNSFRIGMIGVLVEYGGPEQAEGFLHDFEGWVVFMGCIAILLVEMWVLAQIGRKGRHRRLSEVFGIEFPEPVPKDAEYRPRRLPASFVAAALLLVPALVLSKTLGSREEIIPDRPVFAEFPLRIDGWQGDSERLESIYLDALKLDDYLLADYVRQGESMPVNLYVAYYASQRAGASIHSPRSCIPGGGWKIVSVEPIVLPGVTMGGKQVQVNRTLIQKGDAKQVVYYWFQGRGRNLVNEYRTKFYLLWDAIQKNRTDGALVRLTTTVSPMETEADADLRLQAFAKQVLPVLDRFIPE